MSMHLKGCDFSSAPNRKKPIVVAVGRLERGIVCLDDMLAFGSLTDWQASLNQPGPWVGAFDLPFGWPRELVQHLGWPRTWRECIDHSCAISRDDLRGLFKAFCDARPAGQKFAHRACDIPAGSSPSMKWVNPPVAWMLHAGLPRLLAAGLHFPGLHQGDETRVALEAYPGLLARRAIGKRSYKSDDAAKHTPERLIARKDILTALELGQWGGPRIKLTHAQSESLVADASGDRLDAVLCLVQAAFAAQHHAMGHAQYGLPEFDPLEGWIVGA